MNKKIVVIIVSAVIVLGGAAYTYQQQSSNNSVDSLMSADNKSSSSDEISAKSDSSMADSAEVMNQESSASHGEYITLADYNANQSVYSSSTKVLFFHASWCPICQGIHKELTADISRLPAGVTLIKTDFDSETSLRKKYGVTTQYTFVQIDNDGNRQKSWSATNLDKVIAGIQR